MRGLVRFMLPAFIVALSASCWTPYQARGRMGGFDEIVLSPGLYYLTFAGNQFTSQARAIEGWHRRAAELCGGAEAYEVLEHDDTVRPVMSLQRVHVIEPSGAIPQQTTINARQNMAVAMMTGYVRCRGQTSTSTASR